MLMQNHQSILRTQSPIFVYTITNLNAHNHQSLCTQSSIFMNTITNLCVHNHQSLCTQSPIFMNTITNLYVHNHQSLCTQSPIFVYRITNLQEDMRLQKKNMKRMSDRIVELERTLGSSRMYLENIYHKLDKQGEKLSIKTLPTMWDIIYNILYQKVRNYLPQTVQTRW
jgi:uncharacterized coiled-coil protein SlyX